MSIEAMKQALEALESTSPLGFNMESDKRFYAAITALRTAIAEAEKQEPVAWINWSALTGKPRLGWECESEIASEPLYTTPPAAQPAPVQEPVFHLRGYGDVTQDELERLTTPSAAQREPAGSYMTREQAITFCRRRRPGIEPTEQHIAATIDAYAALFGGLAPATPAAQRQPHEWITVDDCMPKPGVYVLAVFRYTTGKQRVIRAMHAPRHTLSEDDYGEFVTEGADYNEATDTTYWPEGWYECNENEETHWQVHEEVTHWMPLPAAPSVGEKPDAA